MAFNASYLPNRYASYPPPYFVAGMIWIHMYFFNNHIKNPQETMLIQMKIFCSHHQQRGQRWMLMMFIIAIYPSYELLSREVSESWTLSAQSCRNLWNMKYPNVAKLVVCDSDVLSLVHFWKVVQACMRLHNWRIDRGCQKVRQSIHLSYSSTDPYNLILNDTRYLTALHTDNRHR
jgi:hypothetical protein